MRCINSMLVLIALMGAVEAWGQGCSASVVGVPFGGYDSSTIAPLDAKGDVSVTCEKGVDFSVRLDLGQNTTTFHPRMLMLVGGSATLNYNLYRDSARTKVFGDGTNNTYIQTGVGTGNGIHFPIFGRIPGHQNISAGQYRDAVTVIVEW